MHLTPTAVSAALLLAPLVAAHGILVSPAPRAGQGIAPGPKFAIFPPPADLMALCGNNNNPGPVSATFTAGESIPVKWQITIPHVSKPGVTISIKYNPGDKFEALASGLDVNSVTSTVKLPADKASDNAVLQWTWASEEDGGFYLECADIAIKPAATAPPKAPEPPVVAAPAPAPEPPVVVAAPAPEPPVVVAAPPAPEPPVVAAPAPEPPVVVAAPAPEPPVVVAAQPAPEPPVVVAAQPAPEPPVVVAAPTATAATETSVPSAPIAEAPVLATPAATPAVGATGATEPPLPDCIPEPVESAPAPAPGMPGMPDMPDMPASMPTNSAPAAEYPQTAPAPTGSTSTEQQIFSAAFSNKVVSGVASALVAGVAAFLTL
ncbi:hypothetical protein HDU90_008737 [Geranomyces variabilis]|nr:hypothetical protein HDU90_008737 [Geranomyces variabilis]